MDDKKLYEKPLYGEGIWIYAIGYEDTDGDTYEIWQDQDGEERVVENVC